MATVKQLIGEHDVVALREATGNWGPGTTGTVVSDYGAVKLVEISDERGVSLDYLQVPEIRLELLEKHAR